MNSSHKMNRPKRNKIQRTPFDAALAYLAFKDRTEREVRDKLREREYPEEQITATLEKLRDYGYLDDEKYARAYIQSNLEKKSVGKIKGELSQKGISKTLSEEAFSQLPVDEIKTMSHMLERRFEHADFSDPSEKRRIYAYFARRGFCYENIDKAVSIFRKNAEI